MSLRFMGMDYSHMNGFSDQTVKSIELSTKETALAIDKIAAIPRMSWDFMNALVLNAQDAFTMRTALESVIRQKHPDHVKILQIHKAVNDSGGILYALDYGKSKGEEIVKIGFTSGYAGIYIPEEHIFTPARLTESMADGTVDFAHVLPPLVTIRRYIDHNDQYCLNINKIQLKECAPLRESDSKLQDIIDTQFAKVLEAFK